jgi:hypothetical protein
MHKKFELPICEFREMGGVKVKPRYVQRGEFTSCSDATSYDCCQLVSTFDLKL